MKAMLFDCLFRQSRLHTSKLTMLPFRKNTLFPLFCVAFLFINYCQICSASRLKAVTVKNRDLSSFKNQNVKSVKTKIDDFELVNTVFEQIVNGSRVVDDSYPIYSHWIYPKPIEDEGPLKVNLSIDFYNVALLDEIAFVSLTNVKLLV